MEFAAAIGIGMMAGLRSMTAPMAVAWAARLGWLNLADSNLAFFGYAYTPYILTVLAIGELVADKLPSTPGRVTPGPFIGRLIIGGVCGAAVGTASGWAVVGGFLGIAGAGMGTFGGYVARTRLAKQLGADLPVALAEDLIAVSASFLILSCLR